MTAPPRNPASGLCLVGVNQHGADVALRDRLFAETFKPEELLARLAGRLTADPGAEAVVLGTGKRLEIAALAEDPDGAATAAIESLAEETGCLAADIDAQCFHYFGAEAARHLFAVTAGLDSQGLSEPQIRDQVMRAHRSAAAAGVAGAGLDALMQAADAAAEQVRAETALADQPVTIAGSALLVARDVHGALDRRAGLLVGLGEMGEFMAAEIVEAGIGQMVVTHPNATRAEAAAQRLGCHFRPWDELDEALVSADIVVTAMGTGRYGITAARAEAALKRRRREAIFLIDAAVPGDVDPAVAGLDGAYLYDLEDLERVARLGQADQAADTATAWRILDEALAAFLRGRSPESSTGSADPRRRRFEAARDEILAEGHTSVETATRRLVERLLRDSEND